jgi:hypothetical protein
MDTPRTERFIAALESEKKDIWEALKLITDWARGLERECASYEARESCRGPSRDGPAWVSAVWNDALDAAARVADEQWCMENSLIGSRLSRKIADAIRDLKHSNATQEKGA